MKNKGEAAFVKKFAVFNVKYRWAMIIVFAVFSVACAGIIPFTKIVYDVSTYLPDQSTSAVGLSVLKEEFDDKGMTYVILENVTPAEAKEIADEFDCVEGVDTVIFEESTYYNKETKSALLTVALTDYDSTSQCFDTMKRLTEEGKKYDATFIGQSASSYYTKLETEESILKIGIAIVVVILIMLLVTSKSFFELIPMLLSFGVAVLLNMGTNFLFNGISYISNLVALVLQLALSIDYSVILMHRFTEETDRGLNVFDAAVEAQRKGIPEILSSSLTTIAGLCALMFMTLGIGVEMGLALAKSIVFSLISVIFFMPALLVVFAKPLQKTRHRSFVPNVTKPTKVIVKGRKIIVPIFLVIVILAGVGQSFNNYAFTMTGGAKIDAAKEKSVETGFGTMNTLVVVLPNDHDYAKQHQTAEYISSFDVIDSSTALSTIQIAEGVYLTDSFTKETLQGALSGMLAGSDDVSPEIKDILPGVSDYLFEHYCSKYGLDDEKATVPFIDLLLYAYTDDPTLSAMLASFPEYRSMLDQLVYARGNLEKDNYIRMTFNINASVEDKEAFELIKELKTKLPESYDEFYMTGETVVCYDMAQYFPQDNRNISLFTLAFILLILFITFKNVLLPLILTLAIQGGIWINFVIPFLSHSSLCFIGYLLITAVQMGATIDYAIVLTNRYHTIRDSFSDREQAMAEALNAVFPTIITSGVILTATGFTLAIASSGVVAAMGALLGSGTALAVMIVLLIMPSLLLVTEKIVKKCDFNKIFKKRSKK